MPAFFIKAFTKTASFSAGFLGAAAVLLAAAPASAADARAAAFPPAYAAPAPLMQQAAPPRPYKGVCNSFVVRASAKTRFAIQMRNVPPQQRLRIKSFSNVTETQYVRGAETYDIDRRYCAATVTMVNGQSYPATYVVARNQGFAGIGGLHISFCVIGLDSWLVRDNDCRSLRSPNRSVY